MIDNDIIVRRRDVVRAREMLLTLGYEDLPYASLEARLRIDFQYAMQRRTAEGAIINAELHWNAFSPLLYRVPEEVLWAHTEPFDLRGMQIAIFDPPLTLVHLAAHFAQHSFSEPRILRDVAAAWNLWGAQIDVDELVSLARQLGLAAVLEYALVAAGDLGLLRVAPPPIGSQRAAFVRRLLPPSRLSGSRPRHNYVRMLLGAVLAEPRRIPAWIFHNSFPPIDVIATVFRRPVTPGLYLRYLTRPLRPLARMLGWKL
jgi:hypothetical protein